MTTILIISVVTNSETLVLKYENSLLTIGYKVPDTGEVSMTEEDCFSSQDRHIQSSPRYSLSTFQLLFYKYHLIFFVKKS